MKSMREMPDWCEKSEGGQKFAVQKKALQVEQTRKFMLTTQSDLNVVEPNTLLPDSERSHVMESSAVVMQATSKYVPLSKRRSLHS